MTDNQPTIYERIGGAETIERLVLQFYDNVLSDPTLMRFFEDVTMKKLRDMQMEFFSAALGGPEKYSGKDLREVHQNRGIERSDFERYIEILLETLNEFDLSEEDTASIVSQITLHVDDIVDKRSKS